MSLSDIADSGRRTVSEFRLASICCRDVPRGKRLEVSHFGPEKKVDPHMRKIVVAAALALSLGLGASAVASPVTLEAGANGLRQVQKQANGLAGANGLK
jgi:hypothetical protein